MSSGNGAGDGSRTRDIQLGRLTLYRLSYSRSMASAPYFERTMHGHRPPQRRTMPLPDAVDHQASTPCPQGSRSLISDLAPAVRVRRVDVEVVDSVGLESFLEDVSVRGVELLLRAGTEYRALAGDDDEVQGGPVRVPGLPGQNERRV